MIVKHIEQIDPIATTNEPTWNIVCRKIRGKIRSLIDVGQPYSAYQDMLFACTLRDSIGRDRYGVPLTSGNGRDSIRDAVEESLDLTVYLENVAIEQGDLKSRMLADEARDFTVRLIAYSAEKAKSRTYDHEID